jgi:hypothetical protein
MEFLDLNGFIMPLWMTTRGKIWGDLNRRGEIARQREFRMETARSF